MKKALTDMSIQKLAPGEYFDTRTPAFAIRIGKHKRTWFVIKGDRRQKFSLGTYPAMSLADARRKAQVALGSPLEQKATITFPEALEAFLAQSRWRPASRRVLVSSLKHFPWQGQLAKISHEQVLEALAMIPRRSAKAHALKDIRTFFNWCVPRYLTSSPAAGIRMEAQPSRDRVLTDEELKAVWIAPEQCGLYGLIIKVLILSGQRRGEIAALQSSWLKDDTLTIPAEVAKNARQHSIPLSSHLCKLVKDLARSNSSRTPFNAWSKSQAALLKLSGVSHFSPHDLRRTFASNQARLGTPIHVTEKMLNHVSGVTGGLVGVYQRHNYWDEQVAAMQRHEDWLLSLLPANGGASTN